MHSAHPFEQYPTEHPGWDRKHFDHRNRTWSLLVINRPGEQQESLIGMVNGRDLNGPWPHYHHMSIGGLVTVDGAVLIIDRIYNSHEQGVIDGKTQARLEMRKALGFQK